MRKTLLCCAALSALLCRSAQAGDMLICRGDIVSKQGEGMVVKSHRFEVEVSGTDLNDVLEKCKKIAHQRQNTAGKVNPGVPFRKMSDLELHCSKGTERSQVRRTLRTSP